jgi:hypothetical protein
MSPYNSSMNFEEPGKVSHFCPTHHNLPSSWYLDSARPTSSSRFAVDIPFRIDHISKTWIKSLEFFGVSFRSIATLFRTCGIFICIIFSALRSIRFEDGLDEKDLFLSTLDYEQLQGSPTADDTTDGWPKPMTI